MFALELTPISRERNGWVAASLVFIPNHARQVESDLRPVVCPGFSKSLFKEAFIVRSHFACPQRHKSSTLTVSLLDKYPKIVQRQKKGRKRPWPEKID
jgi:hypothetical protein